MSEALQFGKEGFDELLASDPKVAEAAAEMRRIAEKSPGVVVAAIHRLESEEILSEPGAKRSLAQYEAGDYEPLTLEG